MTHTSGIIIEGELRTALLNLNVPEDAISLYTNAVKQENAKLVIARADHRAAEAREIMCRAGAAKVSSLE